MLGIERRQIIMDKLAREQKVYVAELSKLFQVTEETIRRDLEKLEKEDLLRRSYGGAVPTEGTSEDFSFVKRSSINSESKDTLARKAAELFGDGSTIMMDSSTTCLALLHYLQIKRNITIITNSIRLAYDFTNSSFRIISTGGNLRANSFALTGSVTCATIAKYYVDFAVFSCKGVDIAKGVMESNEEESVVKQHMMAQAKKTVLLIDHAKFDKTAFTQTCDFSRISAVVTDTLPSAEWQEYLKGMQVELIAG